MKLNSDNYELVMFDLLEGNMSEVNELKVMEQIEGDEFLFKEWKLFKSTVLVCSPETVYKGKTMLLKEEQRVLPFYVRLVAVAASVALVLALFVYLPQRDKQQLAKMPVKMVEHEKNKQVKASNNLHENVVIELKKEDEFEPDIRPKSENNEDVVVGQELKRERKKVMNGNSSPQNMNIHHNTVLSDIVVAQDLPEHLVGMQTPSNKLPKTDTAPKAVVNTEKQRSKMPRDESKQFAKDEPMKGKILTFVMNKSLKHMVQTTVSILAKSRHPKMKMTPDFKGKIPSLNIEIESEGYHVIASLQPTRNRNN